MVPGCLTVTGRGAVKRRKLPAKGLKMADYRVYFLDANDHIFAAENIEAADDHAANVLAQQLCAAKADCCAIEVLVTGADDVTGTRDGIPPHDLLGLSAVRPHVGERQDENLNC